MEAVLDQPVLVLNRLWQAINVICAKRAFALLARGHAAVIHHHRDDFRVFSFMDWMDFSKSNPPLEMLDTVHTPRTTSSTITPSCEALNSAFTTSVSESPLTFMRIRAGRPARACACSSTAG